MDALHHEHSADAQVMRAKRSAKRGVVRPRVSFPAHYFTNPFWLAPMAGVTDKAFRTLCLRHGAGLTCSEMVSAKGLEYDGAKTFALVDPAKEETELVVQLFGNDPACMARQAHRVEEHLGTRLAAIDINMGCPVRKVVRRGEGSALMKTPELAACIVSSIVDAVDVPVTAKFRSGWTNEERTAADFAKRLEQAGASLVSVHGRSSRQMYRGAADWSVICEVKEAVSIPVAGSGDVYSHEDALRMIEQCGVDAVHIARGARGNPWIFTGHVPTQQERLDTMREHYALFCEYAQASRSSNTGEPYLSPLRAQLAWYVKGLPNAAAFRRMLSEAKQERDFIGVFSRIERCIKRDQT